MSRNISRDNTIRHLMKKKLSCLFLAIMLIHLTACTAANAPELTIPAGDTTPPEVPLPPVYDATIEYGEPDLITDNDGPLWTYIRFPAAGDATDQIIARWADDTRKSMQNEIAQLRKDDPAAEGEINIQFDSWLVDGRYAGILENGIFSDSHLAHPGGIVRTFNIDTKNGTLLSNTDILDYSRAEDILALTRETIEEEYPETAEFLEDMDENWLGNIAIGHDGIIVVLERNAYLPGYLGTVKVTLPYKKLGKAFILGTDPVTEPTKPPKKPSSKPSANPVIPNTPPQSGDIDPSKPMIALTFDDGPSKYTSKVLDTLEKYGCHATFCTVGNLVNARADTVKRASDLGCEVIGHSWDHRDLTKLSEEEIKKELEDTRAAIEAATGVSPRLYRPPYGAVNDTLRSVSAELGDAMICWSVDSEDWNTKDADAVYSSVMSHVSDRAIVLSHDLYGTTADAYERIIPELLSQGYQLVTVSELMYYCDKTLEAGKVYYYGK